MHISVLSVLYLCIETYNSSTFISTAFTWESNIYVEKERQIKQLIRSEKENKYNFHFCFFFVATAVFYLLKFSSSFLMPTWTRTCDSGTL